MRSNIMRAIVGLVVVVAAIALFAVLRDSGEGGENGTPASGAGGPQPTDNRPAGRSGEPRIPTIVIRNGKPVGGVTELTYNRGERIRFEVRSDVSDEVHLHGYDVMKDVEAGGSVSFDVPATLEGIFEAELENRGEQIAEITVNP